MEPCITDRLRGSRVITSISGGKYSAEMPLWLTEQGIEHEKIFGDTGWEPPKDVQVPARPARGEAGPRSPGTACRSRFSVGQRCAILAAIGDLQHVSAEFRGGSPIVTTCLKKGMFAVRKVRWCTNELKRQVIFRYFEALIEEGSADSTNCVVSVRRPPSCHPSPEMKI